VISQHPTSGNRQTNRHTSSVE